MSTPIVFPKLTIPADQLGEKTSPQGKTVLTFSSNTVELNGVMVRLYANKDRTLSFYPVEAKPPRKLTAEEKMQLAIEKGIAEGVAKALAAQAKASEE